MSALYRVSGLVTVGCRVLVHAHDEEEAIETARNARYRVRFVDTVYIEQDPEKPEAFVVYPDDFKNVGKVEDLTATEIERDNEPQNVFVDGRDGSDAPDHDGSREKPFRTFRRIRELVRHSRDPSPLVINVLTDLELPIEGVQAAGSVTIRGAPPTTPASSRRRKSRGRKRT